jgi:hypothetical protein
MQFWDNIINAAMLGTDKQLAFGSAQDMPPGLEQPVALIQQNTTKDKEERFLQLASLIFSYRQCGTKTLQSDADIKVAAAEEKKYCSTLAMQTLGDVLTEDSMTLLRFWLQHCDQKQQVVHPAMVPALLGAGVQHKKMRSLITSCCGKRGEWMAGFNELWNFSASRTSEEIWQTASFDERKEVLIETRSADATKAREWLQQTWSQEDAATRAALLETFADTIEEADIPFLESLANDKSKKVKELAVALLKRIPGSSIVKQYEQVLKQAVYFKKEKGLLGLKSKTVLEIKLPSSIAAPVFQSGVEKLSSDKNVPDDLFILYQMISYTPPSFWTQHLQLTPGEVIEQFQKSNEGKHLLHAIGIAASIFKAKEWASYFLHDEDTFYPDLIAFLPKKEREEYLLKLLKADVSAETGLQYAVQQEEEWGHDLAIAVFRHAAKNAYQYNRTFYNQHIHLIPLSAASAVQLASPGGGMQTTWDNTSEYIQKLLNLKSLIIKAFNE